MDSSTQIARTRIFSWILWALVLISLLGVAHSHSDASCVGKTGAICLSTPVSAASGTALPLPAVGGLVLHSRRRDGPLFPWASGRRFRKWAWRRYKAWRRAYRRAKRVAQLARLALCGALYMATLVDWLTRRQITRYLGALPVLYRLLEALEVREIINRHCPTRAEVDHGTVVLVLILNRLVAPRPLYKLVDWLAETVVVHTLGVPAEKFNDDRLGRTLDAIAEQAPIIWVEIVQRALVRFDIDIRFLFYDLTAFVVHGAYTNSELVDFGFAHNTPSDKRKFKVGLTATADGNVPLWYQSWSGRTADSATVQDNMERLARLLEWQPSSLTETLLIGDRATLNDELAVTYDTYGVHYLSGLQPQKKVHVTLLASVPEAQFYAHPLTTDHGPTGYWGLPCAVPFNHNGQETVHRGLVVLSGPMRTALRRNRAAKLRALRAELQQVEAKIGRPWYRSVDQVQARAETRLRNSSVGHLMMVTAYEAAGEIRLRWQVDRLALWRDMQRDGRYLLVTNDPALTPRQMLRRYRSKDGVEKRFTICKQDLRVSPIYLHQDQRIEAMLLVNMIALLTYSLLERQVRQRGLALTTRRLIAQLSTMTLIETHCWDGSVLYRLSPIDAGQYELWVVLREILRDVEQAAPVSATVAGLPPSGRWAIAPPLADPPSLPA